MNDQLVIFALSEQRYAVRLEAVERVVRAVAINPLPQSPEIVAGIVNVQGRIIPVINIRRRFRLPERTVALTDRLIIAHTARRPVGLMVDAVTDVTGHLDQGMSDAENILPGLEYLEGVVKFRAGLVLIHDLDKFLSLDEGNSLDQALEMA